MSFTCKVANRFILHCNVRQKSRNEFEVADETIPDMLSSRRKRFEFLTSALIFGKIVGMCNRRRGLIVRAAALAGVLALSLIMTAEPAMAIETPDYKVVAKQDDFEIRDYPAQTVAEVAVEGDQQAAVRHGFQRLANYIFGANSGRQTIAMTAPVGQIPATPGPASADTLNARHWIVRFDMPRGQDLAALPKPNNAEIRLATLPATRIAAVRFAGLMSDKAAAKAMTALLRFIETRGLHASGPPTLAQYDPPWTLWFLRRNEVLIPVADGRG
jgi:effector-binding domain-containing protein